jgi:hypothetical protein
VTPILLIAFGLIVIGITIWDIRREEADIVFWMEYLWWDVNKTENPTLYKIALTLQILGALIMIAIGVAWLVFFR